LKGRADQWEQEAKSVTLAALKGKEKGQETELIKERK
jgi:hypothetical protein